MREGAELSLTSFDPIAVANHRLTGVFRACPTSQLAYATSPVQRRRRRVDSGESICRSAPRSCGEYVPPQHDLVSTRLPSPH